MKKCRHVMVCLLTLIRMSPVASVHELLQAEAVGTDRSPADSCDWDRKSPPYSGHTSLPPHWPEHTCIHISIVCCCFTAILKTRGSFPKRIVSLSRSHKPSASVILHDRLRLTMLLGNAGPACVMLQFYQIGALYNNSLSVHFYTPNNHYIWQFWWKIPLITSDCTCYQCWGKLLLKVMRYNMRYSLKK